MQPTQTKLLGFRIQESEQTARRDLEVLQTNEMIRRPVTKSQDRQNRRIAEVTKDFVDGIINEFEFLERAANFYEPQPGNLEGRIRRQGRRRLVRLEGNGVAARNEDPNPDAEPQRLLNPENVQVVEAAPILPDLVVPRRRRERGQRQPVVFPNPRRARGRPRRVVQPNNANHLAAVLHPQPVVPLYGNELAAVPQPFAPVLDDDLAAVPQPAIPMIADELAAAPQPAVPVTADELVGAPQPFAPVLADEFAAVPQPAIPMIADELGAVPQPAVPEPTLPRRGRGRPRRVPAVSLDVVEDLAARPLNLVEDLAAVPMNFVEDLAAVPQLVVPERTLPRRGRGRPRRVAAVPLDVVEDLAAMPLNLVEDLAAVPINPVEDLAAVPQPFVQEIAGDIAAMQHPVEAQIVDLAAVLQQGDPEPALPRRGRGRPRRVAAMPLNPAGDLIVDALPVVQQNIPVRNHLGRQRRRPNRLVEDDRPNVGMFEDRRPPVPLVNEAPLGPNICVIPA